MSEKGKQETRRSEQVPEEKPESTSFWSELKRRKVMRVAITYAVVAWLIMQVAGLTFEGFGVPIWAFRFVVIMLWLFFPVALIITWAFELTPEGIKTTRSAREIQGDEPVSKKVQRKRNWMALGFAAAVPTVVFGALALFFYFKSGGDSQDGIPEKSIAVLPLDNLSSDEENAFFADGVQEDILTNLSKIRDMGVVISRSSTLRYRNPDRDLKQIGQELGVRYIVEGSVRRAGNQVMVTVQLIDSRSDDHVWADNYNRELKDIFAIQAEVAKKIASQLHAALSPEEIEKIEYRPTQNLSAYDAYVQARQRLSTGGGHELGLEISETTELLKEATRLDPEFAEAWALLTYNEIARWNIGGRGDPKSLATAQAALAETMRLAPDTPAALYAQATYLTHRDWDLRSAIQLHLRAESIDPKNYEVQWELGSLHDILGELPKARIHIEKSLLSDPLSFRSNSLLVNLYERLGLWGEARSLIQRNVKRSSSQDWWKLRLAQSEFLRTGKKQPLVNAWKSKLHPEDSVTELFLALDSRDYRRAIELVEDQERFDRPFQMLGTERGLRVWSLEGSSEIAALASWFALGNAGQATEAIEARKTSLEGRKTAPGDNFSRTWSELALIYALEGSSEKAERMIEKSREEIANRASEYPNYPFHLRLSLAYLVLGEREKAIDTLEQAKGQNKCELLHRQLQLWPFFDPLRGDPRFDALLEG